MSKKIDLPKRDEIDELLDPTPPTILDAPGESDLVSSLGVKHHWQPIIPEEQIISSYMSNMWHNAKKRIVNENTFAKCFCELNALAYNNGLFYTANGKMSEDVVKNMIWQSLADPSFDINVDVARVTNKLFEAVKLCALRDSLEPNPDLIPFANGDFYVSSWEFRENEFSPVPYRLPIPLEENVHKTPYFDKWMDTLFSEEDQEVIREYIGYCLVPHTKAQKALFLMGEGGAGKSGIGVILQAILGEADLNISSTAEFVQDKFKLAELQNKLVVYDDDLDTAALGDTGLYKKLITNTIPIVADRKYGQPFTFVPSVKLVACCNQMLSSNDTTKGFYRRLLPIVVKPIAPDFKPDPNFYDHLKEEASDIAFTCMFGLLNLKERNWLLEPTQKTIDYMAQKEAIENPLPEFMGTCFSYSSDYRGISTSDMYRIYRKWCNANSAEVFQEKQFQQWLADNRGRYKIEYSTHISVGDKRVRGYKGLTPVYEWSLKSEKEDKSPIGKTIELPF